MRIAKLPIRFELLHQVLNLPPDIHIVGVEWERDPCADLGYAVLQLEAFSDSEFPAKRVTAVYGAVYEEAVVPEFQKWEPIEWPIDPQEESLVAPTASSDDETVLPPLAPKNSWRP